MARNLDTWLRSLPVSTDRPTALNPLWVEQIFTALRVFGVAGGLAGILAVDDAPENLTALAWASLALLIVGTAGLALAAWRAPARFEKAIVLAGFLLDTLVICGFVVAFSHLDPNVAWAMIFTIAADGTLRYGVPGAFAGALAAAQLFAVQAWVHGSMTGDFLGISGYVYVYGTLLGIVGVLCVLRLALEAQVLAARRQAFALADAHRLREQFLAVVSHEFAGTLTAVISGAETLRRGMDRLPAERVDHVLDLVARQGRHLSRIVEDMAAVARAGADPLGVQPRWGDIAGTVDVAIEAAARYRGGQVLDVEAPSARCEVDHDRVQQVLRNLIENAYKYTPGGTVVSVRAAVNARTLELVVSDTGPGLPSTDRLRLFEPFTTGASYTDDGEGYGLGLYLVRQLVPALGGELTVRSESTGTTFRATVPVRSGRHSS